MVFLLNSVSYRINIMCRQQPDDLQGIKHQSGYLAATDLQTIIRQTEIRHTKIKQRNVDPYFGRTAIILVQIFYQCGLIRNNARNCSFIRAISHILTGGAYPAPLYRDAYVKKLP